MLYYVLDRNDQLEPVMRAGMGTICREFGLTRKDFFRNLNNNLVFADHYEVVEGEDEEEWLCCDKFDSRTYYISSLGNFKMYEKFARRYFTENFIFEENGKKMVSYEGKKMPLIELVAKWFVPDWYEGCHVKFLNTRNPSKQYAAENIIVVAKKAPTKKVVLKNTEDLERFAKTNDLSCIKVGMFFNNQLTKIFNSIEECSTQLKIKPEVIAKQISNGRHDANGLRMIA